MLHLLSRDTFREGAVPKICNAGEYFAWRIGSLGYREDDLFGIVGQRRCHKMKQADSSIIFDKLLTAMDYYGVSNEDRERLLAWVYWSVYQFMRLLYKCKKK